MAFDPDAWLASESAVATTFADPEDFAEPARTQPVSFDPDAFLAAPAPAAPQAFDPDKWLAQPIRRGSFDSDPLPSGSEERRPVSDSVSVWKQPAQALVSAGTAIEKGVANTLKLAGRLSDAAGRIDPSAETDVENNPIYQLGRRIEEFAKKDAEVDPRLKGGAAEKIGGTVGTVLSYVPGGPAVTLPRLFADGFESHKEAALEKGQEGTAQALAGGALNLALGLPLFRVAKGVVHAIAPDAAPVIQETVRKVYGSMGLQGVERLLSALESKAPAGVWTKESTEALKASLHELDKEIKAPVTAALRQVVSQAAQSAAIGGAVATGHNLIAQTYDPTRSTFEGVPEALATFGVLGAIGAAAGARGTIKSAREAQEYLRQRFHERPVESEAPAAEAVQLPGALVTSPGATPTEARVLRSFAELPADVATNSAEPSAAEMMETRMTAAQPSAPLDEPIAKAPQAEIETSELREPTAQASEDLPETRLPAEDQNASIVGAAAVPQIETGETELPSDGGVGELGAEPKQTFSLRAPARLTSEQAAAEALYRAELLAEANAAQAEQGPELIEAVIDAGGLPSRQSPHREMFSGELQRIEEAVRDPNRRERIQVNRLFRPDAPANDELATRLRDQGFDVPTPGDVQTLVEDRLRTGRPVYGIPERTSERPFGRAGIDGSEGGFVSTAGFDALLNAGRKIYRAGMRFTEWATRMVEKFGEQVQQFLHRLWRSITGADVLPHARERGSVDISRPTIRVSNKKDGYRDVELRNLDKIPIADLPALVNLTRELSMAVPRIRKLRGARGVFRYDSAGYSIDLDPRLFSDPVVAAKVLAHEIGHAGDFLPDETLKRGNLLGRLATLRSYFASTLPLEPARGGASLTTQDRRRLRTDAQRYIGPRPPKGAMPSEFEAWNERVAKWYQKLVNAELVARGLASDTSAKGVTNNVREELINLSDWWKPYMDAAAEGTLSDSHVAYRNSSKELYADMISVLLNSPRDVKERAPAAYKMFFSYLDRKPEVRSAFFDTWDALGGDRGRLVAARRQMIRKMFKSGEELFNKKIEERARTTSWTDWLAALRAGLDTRYWAAIKRERTAAAAGNKVAQQRPLEWLFDSHPLADNQVFVALHKANEAVRKPLLEAGLSEIDLGEYLFFDRVANESFPISEKLAAQMESDHGGRAHIANPEGHTPETAREQLAHMELALGHENFRKVEAAANRFHELFFEAMQRMRDEGMISDEAWGIVEQNREHYVTFQALAYADLHVPAGIRQQMGYLGEIANPHTSTTLKWITALRAVEFNKAKRVTIEHLRQYFPDEITDAPVKWDGRKQVPQEPRDHDLALVSYMKAGHRTGVHVPREIAEMLEHTDSALLEVLHKVLSPVEWLWQQVFYPSYITFSPLFQIIRNPVRDIRRTALNLPDEAGVRQAIAIRWGETRRMVKEWVKEGKAHQDILDALDARAIPTPMGTWQRQMGPHEDMFITIASRFGLARPGTVKEGHVFERAPVIGPLFRALAAAGQVRELTPKLGAYHYFTRELGFSSEDAAGYVRNWVGTPPWYKKGVWTRLAGDVFPFTNVWMKGWQADARLMRGRSQLPSGRKAKSAASWWLRWMLTGGTPKILMAAAAAGVFGETLRRLYARVGNYWMTNYDVVPIGEQGGGIASGGKTVFIPVPKDFTDRMLGGVVYLLARAGFDAMMKNKQEVRPAQAFSLATSDMPGVNPAVKVLSGWSTYLSGGNPYDSFRNSHVLTQQQEDAGWRYSVGPMLKWTWEQNGASAFVRWNGDGSLTEQTVAAIPGLNGLVKWSDTGLREDLASAEQEERGVRARFALSMPAEVQHLRHEYNLLKGVNEERRTPEMQYRYEMLSVWNGTVYDSAVESAQLDASSEGLRKIGQRTRELSRPFQRKK